MGLDLQIGYNCNEGILPTSDETRTAAQVNLGGLSKTFTTDSSSTAPTKSSTQEATLAAGIAGLTFDGTDGLNVVTAYDRTDATAWGFVMAWTNCLGYLDKYLIDGGTEGNHIRFVDASTIEFRGGGSKGAATSLALNNTNNSTVSYTFGSDVEVLIFQVTSSGVVSIYNIDGDLIYNSGSAVPGAVATFNIEHVLHDSTYAKNPRLKLLGFYVWEADDTSSTISTTQAANVAAYYTNLKNI